MTHNPLNLPSTFNERIINTFGDKGRAWLESLPDLLTDCEKSLNLKIGNRLKHLSYNYVAEAMQVDGSEVIIKIGASSSDFIREIKALEFMHGPAVVEVLFFDDERSLALLEKLEPGEMLKTLTDDAKATKIAASVMQRLWKPIQGEHNYPTTQQWFERLLEPVDSEGAISPTLLERASKIAAELHQSMGEQVLLHGDLHHENILSATREPWIAIDPKGVVGEREYEVGALLRNPIPDIATTMDTAKVLARRIDQLSEQLAFDQQRLMAWSFSQAVLAAIWGLDGKSNDWHLFIKCAEALSEIMRSRSKLS